MSREARARLSTVPARPAWVPLYVGGQLNVALRELTRGGTGVYAVRLDDRVLYVGESHTDKATPLRWWKTLLRHFQGCDSGLFLALSEWQLCRKGDVERLEIAIWRTVDGAGARELEAEIIERLNPEGNKVIEVPPTDEVPF